MIANMLARISCKLIGWAIRLRGNKIVITRPWAGGRTVVYEGLFDGALFERVHDGRGFIFFVKAKPKRLSTLFQLETESTRPRYVDFQTLKWDPLYRAWHSAEPD